MQAVVFLFSTFRPLKEDPRFCLEEAESQADEPGKGDPCRVSDSPRPLGT